MLQEGAFRTLDISPYSQKKIGVFVRGGLLSGLQIRVSISVVWEKVLIGIGSLSKHAPQGGNKVEQRSIDVLIEKYLSYCKFEKSLESKTQKAYRIDLRQFADYIEDRGSDLSKDNLQAYLTELHRRYKIKSVKRKIASLKAFFNYLEYEAILLDNPLNRMRIKLHEPFLLPRTIPLDTVDSILKCAYRQKQSTCNTPNQMRNTLRDIAVLELLFATGMRVSELCFLRKGSINLSSGEIKIYGKGAKERLMQIGNNDVLSALSSYYAASSTEIENSGWFFVNRFGQRLSDQSVRNMINRYTALAGIEQHITPHMFRHAFATLLLEEDVDIRYIQQLLGHSSISTTQIYTHVTSKKQRDILTAKHPRNKISI